MKPRIDDTQLRANTAHHWSLILAILSQVGQAIAFNAVLDWSVYRAADRWLRDIEAFARRVLLPLAVGLKFKPVQRTSGPPPPAWRPYEYKPREVKPLFRLQLFGGPPAPYALVETRRRTQSWDEWRAAPLDYDAAPLHQRIAALRAVCADPMHHARRMARRMAHRFDRTPKVLRQLARKRPCMELRNALLAHFRQRPEMFVSGVLRSGADPPSPQDDFGNVVPLFNAHYARRLVMLDRTGKPKTPRQKRIFLYDHEIEDIKKRTPRILAWNEKHKAEWRAEAKLRRQGSSG
ncbi:MAG: hypothetical protein SGJ23_02330 [Alphaproteobacteria bacterium]|nr:hypothetical protein [Alphaproteobacteria bacterium]